MVSLAISSASTRTAGFAGCAWGPYATHGWYHGCMLSRQMRRLSPEEQAAARARLPLLSFRARHEVRLGEVEVLTFDVRRVWTLISCRGPGCCPNTWLIDTGEDYVFARSWDFLGYAGDDFPGSQVTIERLPRSKRLLRATAVGPYVTVIDEPEMASRMLQQPLVQCEVIPRHEVRPASDV